MKSRRKGSSWLSIQINIDSANRKFYLVFFTTITAFLFLNFFQPFGLYYNEFIPKEEVFIELFVAMLVANTVLFISQFFLRKIFRVYKLTVSSLIGWFLFEALLVAIPWTALDYYIQAKTYNTLYLFFENSIAYILIMAVPYFFYAFFVSYKDALHVNEQSLAPVPEKIVIKDESGVDRLVIETEKLVAIQSADNYVEVYHIENEGLIKTMVRNTIKNLELLFENYPIIRCHRSYMINTKKIETARKTASGFDLKMHLLTDKLIPVSKSYVSELKKHI